MCVCVYVGMCTHTQTHTHTHTHVYIYIGGPIPGYIAVLALRPIDWDAPDPSSNPKAPGPTC